MPIRPTSAQDIALGEKVYRILVWVQAAMGVFLLAGAMNKTVHAVLAAVVLLCILLTVKLWEKKGIRIALRILTGILAYGVPAILLAEAVLTAVDGAAGDWTEVALYYAMVIGGIFSYMSPVTARISLCRCRYDRIVACLVQTLLLGAAVLSEVSEEVCYSILWTFDNFYARLAWIILTAFTAILAWMLLFARTPEEKEQAARRKENKKK